MSDTWRTEERERAAFECCDVAGLDHCGFHLQLVEERIEARRKKAESDTADEERALEADLIAAVMREYEYFHGPQPVDGEDGIDADEVIDALASATQAACAALRAFRAAQERSGVMGRPGKQTIVDAWNVIESADPDISTERLFAMVCERFNHTIDDGDVSEALYWNEKKNAREKAGRER